MTLDEAMLKTIEKCPESIQILIELGFKAISYDDLQLASIIVEVQQYQKQGKYQAARNGFRIACIMANKNPFIKEKGQAYLQNLKAQLY